LHKDGHPVTLETNGVPIFDPKGGFKGYRGIDRDISGRKQAERALRESEERLRAIFDSVQAGIVIVDKKEHVILDVNPAAARMIGASVRRLIGNRCHKFICPAEEGRCPITDLMLDVDNSERVLLKADGTSIPVLKTVVPMVIDNREVLLESFIDLTKFKESEEEKAKLGAQLRHAQKMEAIGTLAGGIAHDFNNILTAVLGYTELALFRTAEGADPHDDLIQVLKAANRAKDLVKQILAFSRHSEGEPKPTPVGPILKEALALLRATLPSTIEMRHQINVHDADESTILADPTQIHQVIMNLCTNAAHAMRETGGSLTVSLSNIEFRSQDLAIPPDLNPGAYLKLTVSDTGHGMDRTTVERIFEPYFTTKGPGEGSGLGLAVAHGIVKRHGGIITVYSEPEIGTTFNVFLPGLDSDREVVGNDENITSLPGGNECILFVDDEAILAEMGQRLLEGLGYTVVAVTGSLEALEIFRGRPEEFDLIITDQIMPRMTGLELTRKIRDIRPEMPIILYTGFSEDDIREKAAVLGVENLLTKPVVIRDLADTVRKVLDGA
jgi:PAS domain S-box-containing protein